MGSYKAQHPRINPGNRNHNCNNVINALCTKITKNLKKTWKAV